LDKSHSARNSIYLPHCVDFYGILLKVTAIEFEMRRN